MGSREFLVNKLRDHENEIRGQLTPFGLEVGQVSTSGFAERIRELVEGRPRLRLCMEALLAAREFESTAQSIANWVRQAERDAGKRSDGPTSAEREELIRLRLENHRLRQERDILSKAAAWLARESKAKQMLDVAAMRELLSKMVGPAVQRDAVAHMHAIMGLSERRACAIVGTDHKMVRYRSCRPLDTELRTRLRDL